MVDEAVALTRSIIEQERENIERLADLLIDKETIFTEDIEAILGKSAQQIEKDTIEADSKVEAEDAEEKQGVVVESDNGSITYVIEPEKQADTDENL